MIVYGIRAKGPYASFDSEGTIFSRTLYKTPPSAEVLEAFRSKLTSPPGSISGMGDLDPAAARITVVEFELLD